MHRFSCAQPGCVPSAHSVPPVTQEQILRGATWCGSLLQGDHNGAQQALAQVSEAGGIHSHGGLGTSGAAASPSRPSDSVLLFPGEWQSLADAETHFAKGQAALVQKRWGDVETDSSLAIDGMAGASPVRVQRAECLLCTDRQGALLCMCHCMRGSLHYDRVQRILPVCTRAEGVAGAACRSSPAAAHVAKCKIE